MSNLSVIILTYNEELHIKRCIESIKKIADTIYIVDSYSSDNTVSIAKELGANVFQRKWKNYADQFQWALDHCNISSEWIMRLDADEYLDLEMQSRLVEKINSLPSDVTGLCCYLRNVYFGKLIRFGGYDPLRLLRIWRNGVGHIESRWMDEHLILSYGDISQAPGQLIHNNLNNHKWWIDKHNKYADREMIDYLNNKYNFLPVNHQPIESGNNAKIKRLIKEKIYNKLPIFVRSICYFIFRYIFSLGFLDGREGFAYHFFQAFWYRTLVDARIYEAEKLIKNVKQKNEIINILQEYSGLKLN